MKVGKKTIKLAIAFIVLVIVLEFIMQLKVHSRNERNLSEAFLRKNHQLSELVGDIKNISYLKEGVDVASYSDRTEGIYRFKVTGSKKTEEVSIYWVTTDVDKTIFYRIELSNPWQQAKIIWQTSKPK